jgi:two-component system, LytTR family, response regulator
MKPMQAVIADDEKPARDRLKRALEGHASVEVVGEAANGSEAVTLIRSLQPGLVFLDIQMPVLDGFQVLEQLVRPPAVIFTTAYDEYALRAFDVHAVDYLLKPYDRERLNEAIHRALGRLRSGSDTSGLTGLLEDYRRDHPYLDRLTIKSGRVYKVVSVESVEYFLAEEGLVFCVDGRRRLQIDETLKNLEERLDPAQFLRIHRNCIANLGLVDRVIALGHGRLSVEFVSGDRMDVGRTRTEPFRKAFQLSRRSRDGS